MPIATRKVRVRRVARIFDLALFLHHVTGLFMAMASATVVERNEFSIRRRSRNFPLAVWCRSGLSRWRSDWSTHLCQ